MADTGRYVVAGRDLERFTTSWLETLEDGGGHARGLLEEGPEFSASFLTANIAPHAVNEDASDETMLLYAVLFVHQVQSGDGPLGPPLDGWSEMRAYVANAFDTFQAMGPYKAAAALIRHVLDKMEPDCGRWAEIKRKRREEEPRRGVWLEQELAKISQREIRAARLLDPTADFDAAVLAFPSAETGEA